MRARHSARQTTSRTRTTLHEENEDIRSEIIDWLRDAYAMERGLETALEKQARNQDLSAAVRERAAAHREETRHHAEEVESVLHSLDANTSAIKTTMGIMGQATKGMGTVFARDERIKDMLDAYSMENFEIACYTALAAAAERGGYSEVVDMCRRIIPDEQRMAQTLLKALPTEVTHYLFEKQSSQT